MERFALFERCFIAVKVLKQSNILKAMLVDFVVNILAPKIGELFDVSPTMYPMLAANSSIHYQTQLIYW